MDVLTNEVKEFQLKLEGILREFLDEDRIEVYGEALLRAIRSNALPTPIDAGEFFISNASHPPAETGCAGRNSGRAVHNYRSSG